MPVSASEIEKMEATKKKASRRRYTEAYRVEAVQYYLKAREVDPKKTIKECAKELGVNEKTFNDWVIKYEAAGKVERGRTEEQRALDEANRRIRELELENEFLKKASAFFARSLA
jgi:transposase